MKNLWTITWRELRAYFASPLAYVLSAAYLALSGVCDLPPVLGTLALKLRFTRTASSGRDVAFDRAPSTGE